MKKIYVLIVALFITSLAGVAAAHVSSPNLWYTFAAGETLTAEKLNNNFAHLHATLTGGIKNENIAPDAAIAASKLATPGLVAKAVGGPTGVVSPGCPVSTNCTLRPGTTNIANVYHFSTGNFDVYFTTPMSTTNYTMIISSSTGFSICRSDITQRFTAFARVICVKQDNTGVIDADFDVAVFAP